MNESRRQHKVAEEIADKAGTFLALYAPGGLGAGSLGGLLSLAAADKAATAGIAAVFTVVMGVLGAKAGSSSEDASVR